MTPPAPRSVSCDALHHGFDERLRGGGDERISIPTQAHYPRFARRVGIDRFAAIAASHHASGRPMSQRLRAGFNWPLPTAITSPGNVLRLLVPVPPQFFRSTLFGVAHDEGVNPASGGPCLPVAAGYPDGVAPEAVSGAWSFRLTQPPFFVLRSARFPLGR